MKNLFVSQPRNNKTPKEIDAISEEAIEEVQKYFPDEKIVLVEPYITDIPKTGTSLWNLGLSIMALSRADVAYFALGWRDARRCYIENICAVKYGIMTIETPEE